MQCRGNPSSDLNIRVGVACRLTLQQTGFGGCCRGIALGAGGADRDRRGRCGCLLIVCARRGDAGSSGTHRRALSGLCHRCSWRRRRGGAQRSCGGGRRCSCWATHGTATTRCRRGTDRSRTGPRCTRGCACRSRRSWGCGLLCSRLSCAQRLRSVRRVLQPLADLLQSLLQWVLGWVARRLHPGRLTAGVARLLRPRAARRAAKATWRAAAAACARGRRGCTGGRGIRRSRCRRGWQGDGTIAGSGLISDLCSSSNCRIARLRCVR